MSKNFFRGSLSRSEPSPSMEMPRLRFDDFTYESRISGPDSRSCRPTPNRNRASWTFPLRSGSGSSSSSSSGSESCTATAGKSSTASVGVLPEPPSSGIMKTMEIELSYEDRTWTKQGRMMPRDECMLRPHSLSGFRRLTSGEVPLLPDIDNNNLSPLSADFDLESGFDSTTFRHSSPPEASWHWSDSSGTRETSEHTLGLPSPTEQSRKDNGQLGDS